MSIRDLDSAPSGELDQLGPMLVVHRNSVGVTFFEGLALGVSGKEDGIVAVRRVVPRIDSANPEAWSAR